ncbi:hypothetical protein [Streptomyces marispadix]|uniref:Secreted protein n=1 Tax=Streptomyces marispadix TaxID=2922868 RepID=A0ABS9SZM9_9ACTN|nr:hypothetical protein [Streptomyces marispadix]MCH6161707.1 hypothetical protein [Streptomyces marispadix]
MRKLREAAVVVAMVGSVGMIGAGAAAAHGEPPSAPVSIDCDQDTGDNTLTNQEGGTANVNGLLNGGDADASANQQLCGLDNEDAENTAGEADGGDGGVIGGITIGGAA